jgi:nanoRNase/pAp phosphatase (c-di-AMP/oligoRNAs hydrolase)
VVVVADQPATRSRAVAEAVRTALPEATLVVVLDTDAGPEDRAAVDAVADRVVAGAETVARAVTDAVVGPGGEQARRLHRTLRSVAGRSPEGGRLAVVMHDNPDPDAIASAVALVRVAAVAGVEAVPCYYGRVSHQENRAMVNLLDLDLRRLPPDDDLSEFDGIALVDHSRPGVNDQLSPDRHVDVVIDHHPPRAPVDADFVDLRGEVGATSTLLTGYLARFGVPEYGGAQIATALLYGIRVDTAAFTREVTAADFEAAAVLSAYADADALDRIESPSVAGETLDTVGRAVRNRDVRGDALASCVGPVHDRDALAQAADRLLDLEGVTTTLVFGYDDDPEESDTPTVYASARARGTGLDLGETLRLAFDSLGSAGGHADMAGAQIPLSALGADVLELTGEEREAVVREMLTETFFDALVDRPREVPRAEAAAYDPDRDDGTDDSGLPPTRAPADALPVEWTVRDAGD